MLMVPCCWLGLAQPMTHDAMEASRPRRIPQEVTKLDGAARAL
jgi:hypothetical protein